MEIIALSIVLVILAITSKIGEFSSIMSNTSISGHCEIGSQNYIGTNANLIPNIKTEKNITIGVGSVVLKKSKKRKVLILVCQQKK